MTMPFGAALAAIGTALQRLGIPWFVGGSVASLVHGEIRTTQDVDSVIDIGKHQVDALAAALAPDFLVDRGCLAEAVRTGTSCNVLHRATGKWRSWCAWCAIGCGGVCASWGTGWTTATRWTVGKRVTVASCCQNSRQRLRRACGPGRTRGAARCAGGARRAQGRVRADEQTAGCFVRSQLAATRRWWRATSATPPALRWSVPA